MQREYLFTEATIKTIDDNDNVIVNKVLVPYSANDTQTRIKNKVCKALGIEGYNKASYAIVGHLVEVGNEWFYNNGKVTKTRRVPLTFKDGKQEDVKITEVEFTEAPEDVKQNVKF